MGAQYHRTFAYRVSMIREKEIRYPLGETANNGDQVAHIIRQTIEKMGQSDRENLVVLFLNAKNKAIGTNVVSIGGVTGTYADPKDVLLPAIQTKAVAIIIGHNHPSGDTTPSPEDIAFTRRLILGAHFLGITVHDSVIVSMESEAYYSLATSGDIRRFLAEAKLTLG